MKINREGRLVKAGRIASDAELSNVRKYRQGTRLIHSIHPAIKKLYKLGKLKPFQRRKHKD